MLQSVPFAEDFIAITADHAESLAHQAGLPLQDWSQMYILLPNRRAVRALKIVLSQRYGVLIPPCVRPLGEPEVDDFHDFFPSAMSTPETSLTVISTAQRALVLTWLMGQVRRLSGVMGTPETDIDIALSLITLIDRLQEHGLELTHVTPPTAPEMAQHWQWAQKILGHLAPYYQQWLSDNALQEPIVGRSRRLVHFASRLGDDTPVIIAGSSGRAGAVQQLMHQVAAMRYGRVLLQGMEMTPGVRCQALAAVAPSHPNYHLCRLLHSKKQQEQQEEQARTSLADHLETPPVAHAEAAFFVKLMQTAAMQMDAVAQQEMLPIEAFPQHIHGLVFRDQLEEVAGVSLLAHHALHHRPEATVAVIVQDEHFIGHLQRQCARFGLALDRAAGVSLAQTPLGRLSGLLLEIYQQGWDVVRFLAVLKHPLTHLGQDRAVLRAQLAAIERDELQAYHAETLQNLWPNVIAETWQDLHSIDRRNKRLTKAEWLSCWRDDLALLCRAPDSTDALPMNTSAEQRWQDWWDMAYTQCRGLDEQLYGAEEFCRTMLTLMRLERVTTLSSSAPSVLVLSALEARLMRFDRVIIPQMIVGQYPPESNIEPWLYRQFYHQHDMPPPEENQGLAAHDFIGLLHQPEVFLTRTDKIDSRKVAPCLWWQKLELTFAAANDEAVALVKPHWRTQMQTWLDRINYPSRNPSAGRPNIPPVAPAYRPQYFRVSQITTLLHHPYAIYAEEVLRLTPREIRFEDIAAREQGQMLHQCLEQFVNKKLLHNRAQEFDSTIRQLSYRPTYPSVFRQQVAYRLRRIAPVWLKRDALYVHAVSHVEHKVTWEYAGLCFRGKIDRLVETAEGWVMIDYKTGTPPSKKSVKERHQWQLPLLALMVRQQYPLASLCYWQLNEENKIVNVAEGEEIITLCATVCETLVQIGEKLEQGAFDFPTQHDAPPEPYDRYTHLARCAEWTEALVADSIITEDNDAFE